MVIDRFYPLGGGAEIQAFQLAQHLQAEGLPVRVITRRVSRDFPAFEAVEGLPIYRVSPGGLRTHFVTAVEFFTFVWALWRHRNEYDVLHSHDARTVYLAAMVIHRLTGKPLVAKVLGVGTLSRDETSRPRHTLYSKLMRHLLVPRWLWNRLLHQSSAWIALNDAVVAELAACGLADLTRRIPNAVDPERFHPATADERQALRKQLGLPDDRTIVISHGRIGVEKRLDILIEGIARLRRDYPKLFVVLPGDIYREDGGIEATMKAKIDALGLKEDVLLPGRSEQVEDYLRASDIYALASPSEGMPNALLEAMAAGLPVVATAISGVTGIVTDHENGLLYPPLDAEALAVALRQYLDDPTLAAQMGARGRETVQERYAWDEVTRRYIDLYNELLGRRG